MVRAGRETPVGMDCFRCAVFVREGVMRCLGEQSVQKCDVCTVVMTLICRQLPAGLSQHADVIALPQSPSVKSLHLFLYDTES